MNLKLVSTLSLILFCGAAMGANNSCWIDHVTSDGSALRVFFVDNAKVEGHWTSASDLQGRPFTVRQGRVIWSDRGEPSLQLKPGEWTTVIENVENNCKISFETVDGHAGIKLQANIGAKGAEMVTTDFMPADVVAAAR